MQVPPKHGREQERLSVLRALELLDTESDPAYDDIVELASAIAGSPVALISLIDTGRQWFKASVGMGVPETPRDVAFCAHAILGDDPLMVADARLDPRFQGNPLTVGPGAVVHYVGVPLKVGPERLPVGTLCVLGPEPKQSSAQVVRQLELLAGMVERLLEARYELSVLAARVTESSTHGWRLGDVLETMMEGVILHAEDGRVAWSNPAAANILGVSQADLVGRSTSELGWGAVQLDGTPLGMLDFPAVVALREGRVVEDQIVGILRGDRRIWLKASGVPLMEAGAVMTFVEITDLVEAREAAEEADRVKSRFLVTMSHEIRTPMNGVVGLTDVLLGEPLTEAQRPILETLRASGAALQVVLDDVLAWSLLEREEVVLDVRSVGVASIVGTVGRLFTPLAKRRGLALEWSADADLVVKSDPVRLHQILHNLVGNALKFTDTGSVTLRATADGEAVRFEVVDTGLGMEPRDLERVFRRFETLAPPGSGRTGVGLGLAIAKSLAERMGGTLEGHSSPGQGSRFTVRLPRSNAGEADRPQQDWNLPPRGHVLVAEDNKVNTLVLVRLLEQLGQTVVTVDNGAAALAALEAERFDVVMMDVHMPDMDGLEATRALRKVDAPWAGVPVVGVTASAMPDEVMACRDAGMNDVVVKPVTVHSLARALHAWGRSEARRVVG